MNGRTKYLSGLVVQLIVAVMPQSHTRAEAPSSDAEARGQSRTLSTYDQVADEWLARMTLAEKIGQMTQAELTALDDLSAIADLALGSVLCGGGADPKGGNSVGAWADAYDACQAQTLESRLKIPLIFGVDAMHGHSNVLGSVIFPHNIGLGCTRNAALVEEIGRVTALEVRATGINWAFAPCVTVPQDDRWGRTYEGYSEDPAVTAELGAALVRGLQGDGFADPRRVLACAKHFVGDGGTAPAKRNDDAGPRLVLDQGDVRIDEHALRATHLRPYLPAIAEGVGSVMVSYSSWNGLKCTANRYLLTDVLKNELGFEGLVVSDYKAIGQVDPDFKTAIEQSINAGIDMAMEPTDYRQFIELLTALVEEGKVPEDRIDDAVRRILRVKAAMGLLEPEAPVKIDRTLMDSFGSPERRQLGRQAVRESLVLLKNDKELLPLAKQGARIHVAGHAADDIGIQCGGWTIEWQGRAGDVTTGGTTILKGIRQAVGEGANISHDADGAGAAAADVAVVVVGELPYAEGNGDDADLALSSDDLQTIRRIEQAGVPMVLIVLSGRPLVLGEAADAAEAIVAAWLPGTEGAGVADVLFGDYAPTGKLSFSWPYTIEQQPINIGQVDYAPLYPFGYGLSYPK